MKRYLLFILSALIVFYSCQKSGTDDNTTPPPPPPPPPPTDTVTPKLTVSRSAIEVGAFTGYTDTFTVQSNINWSISIDAAAAFWLKWDTVKQGSGNTVVKLSITSDATVSQTSTVTISPVGNTTISPLVITLKQTAYSLLWQKAFGASNASGVSGIVEAADGGYIFAGEQDNGWVFKTDANGNKQWDVSTTARDNLWSVTIAADGGYVAAGWRLLVHPVYGYLIGKDLVVVKINAGGTKVWEKTFGGANDDDAYKVLSTADGGYIIAGTTSSNDGDVSGNHGGSDMWLLKIDASGNKVWTKTYGGSKGEYNASLAAMADGGYLLTGSTESTDGDVSGSHGGGDVVVLKLDASGNKIWSKTFGGSKQDNPNSIIATKDGGSMIVGYTNSNDGDISGNHSNDDDMWVLKLDNNGQKTWQAALGGTNMDQASSVIALADGSYLVSGFAFSNNGDVSGHHGDKDFWVVKVSSTGKTIWKKAFGGPGTDWPNAIIATTDGSFVTAGFSTANGGDVTGISGATKGWVVKFK